MWVKIPSRCAAVIAARLQSGTHSLSTDMIQRRVDQIKQSSTAYSGTSVTSHFLTWMGVLFLLKNKVELEEGEEDDNRLREKEHVYWLVKKMDMKS
ncbi:hypothetical protein [Acetobacterium bakii]|nr:hypothetical protein [Acetobacterium bakii]